MPVESKQQQETLKYFHEKAGDWRSKAANIDPSRKFNVIATRNAYVVEVAKRMGTAKSALDVGCGTGELVCDLACEGIHSVGIDFAPDMIRLCDEKMKSEHVEGAEFICESIFDYQPAEKFDVIAANGFIEYTSLEQTSQFFTAAKSILTPRGALVFGSRNRLFNVTSLNAFTTMELELGTMPAILEEAVAASEAKDQQSFINFLLQQSDPPARPEKHPQTTGIEVTTRHQFTPGELVRMLREHDYETVEVRPVHIHCGPASFKERFLPLHIAYAESMQEDALHHLELLPFASTFMIWARPKTSPTA